MPINVIKVTSKKYLSVAEALRKKDIRYEYPEGLDFRPGSKLHNKIRDLVIAYANDSHDAIYRRRNSWTEIERTLTAYIPLSDSEQAIKDDDSRKPVRIVIPASFATLETLLTYNVGAFLRDPYFHYEGYGPEDSAGAMLLQASVQQQAMRARMGLALHTWWRDGYSAGFGAATPMFKRSSKTRTVRRRVNRPQQSNNRFVRAFNEFVSNGEEFEEIEVPAWEGSVLYNIDYRNFLPDPTVPVYDTHKAEAAGWIRRTNWITLKEEELSSEGDMFNVDYLKDTDATSQLFDEEGSTGRSEGQTGGISTGSATKVNVMDVIYKYIKLIPRDYNLSDSTEPEIWLIGLAGDQIIIQCNKVDNIHGMIPIVVNAPDFDGHTLLPNSRLETIYGLQQFMDWSFNSMIANQRKSLNDMFVVDPSLINMYDLSNPGPGKLIRLRRSVFGRGVNDAVKQLEVRDVTQNNINNVLFVMDMINRTSAAVDSVQGIIRRGSERRTATEFQGTFGSALSRLEKTAKMVWLQGHHPLQDILAQDTQQYMKGEQYARINKEWQEIIVSQFGKNSVFEASPGNYKAIINPDRLNYNYDIIAHDGTMPGAGDPQVWQQVLQTIGSSDFLAQKIDLYKVFKQFALTAGAKNIEDFELSNAPTLQPQVVPDEEVIEQQQRGDLLPIQ